MACLPRRRSYPSLSASPVDTREGVRPLLDPPAPIPLVGHADPLSGVSNSLNTLVWASAQGNTITQFSVFLSNSDVNVLVSEDESERVCV
jgi:hypothetical protein